MASDLSLLIANRSLPICTTLDTYQHPLKEFGVRWLFAGIIPEHEGKLKIRTLNNGWVLITCLKGSGLLRWPGGEIEAEAGSAYLVPSRLDCKKEALNKKTWITTYTIIGLSRLSPLWFDGLEMDQIHPIAPDLDLLRCACAIPICLSDRQKGYEIECQGQLLVLLSRLQGCFDPQRNLLSNSPIASAIKAIEEHPEESFAIDELAKLCHMGKSSFSSKFKQALGMSPIQYLIKCKIERSRQYLASGKSVKSIADELGFKSPFYFSKVFKDKEGLSPSEFQKSVIPFPQSLTN